MYKANKVLNKGLPHFSDQNLFPFAQSSFLIKEARLRNTYKLASIDTKQD